MILRHAVEVDRAVLAEFDLGDTSAPWLGEVAEIVAGLFDWRTDPAAREESREVVLAELDGEVVGVAAHAALVADDGTVWPECRYLMVTAVRADQRRTGVARLLVESVLADLVLRGVESVEWLVHPRNTASLGFAHSVFHGVEETYPPEDEPYARFVIGLPRPG